MVKWVSAFELSNNNKWRWWMYFPSCLGLYRLQAGLWLKSVGLVQRSAAAWRFELHLSNEPGELSQCSKHDDSTINIVVVIIIIIWLNYSQMVSFSALMWQKGHLACKQYRTAATVGLGFVGKNWIRIFDYSPMQRCSWIINRHNNMLYASQDHSRPSKY